MQPPEIVRGFPLYDGEERKQHLTASGRHSSGDPGSVAVPVCDRNVHPSRRDRPYCMPLTEATMITTGALLTLAEYLEISLDTGGSVIMMQSCGDVCAIYVGDSAEPQDHWKYHGTITTLLANDILKLTHSGTNRVEIGGQKYRFVRSFTHFEDRGAVVFSAK